MSTPVAGSLLDAARAYIVARLLPVPVPYRSKSPAFGNWPELRITAETCARYFNGRPQNIGIIVGDDSGTTDVDLDCIEAVRAAPSFLPSTKFVFGHRSKPASHWFYRIDPPQRSRCYKDTNGKMIAELRCQTHAGGIGLQTIAPPSVHEESGELIRFEPGCGPMPQNVDADTLLIAVARTAAAALLAKHWPQAGQGRHNAMLALAGGLARAGWTQPDVTTFCRAVYHSLDDPDPKQMHRSASEVESTFRQKNQEREYTGWPHLSESIGRAVIDRVLEWLGIDNATKFALRSFPYTDSGNAERLIATYGRDLRYSHPQRTWFRFDGISWIPDRTGHTMNLAKSVARELYAEASKIEKDHDRKACVDFARKSESTERKKAALISAQSEPGVPVLPEQFDCDPFLLNCLNGTLDLRSGQLRPHRRDDLLTKVCQVKFDPGARSQIWEQFLDDITGGDRELRDFLQRAVGYSLTGDVSEEVLFLVHGPGAAGKSTFLEPIKAALGDYAKTADFETFIKRPEAGGVRNDVAELAGRRFVAASEVDEGKKLAEGLVKLLTGGDSVRARFLYQEAFDFTPQFKLWLAANHAPRVASDDSAIWRRIIRIPFESVVPKEKRDPTLKARLRNDAGPAILAWAVEGCLRWREDGLHIPQSVEAATEDYRLDMDPLTEFLSSCCVLKDNAWSPAGKLRAEYEKWCQETGERHPLGARSFAAKLRQHGCVASSRRAGDSGKSTRCWNGIGLVTSTDD